MKKNDRRTQKSPRKNAKPVLKEIEKGAEPPGALSRFSSVALFLVFSNDPDFKNPFQKGNVVIAGTANNSDLGIAGLFAETARTYEQISKKGKA